jgi:hypothetical protein
VCCSVGSHVKSSFFEGRLSLAQPNPNPVHSTPFPQPLPIGTGGGCHVAQLAYDIGRPPTWFVPWASKKQRHSLTAGKPLLDLTNSMWMGAFRSELPTPYEPLIGGVSSVVTDPPGAALERAMGVA